MIAAEIVDAVNSGNTPAALLKNEVGEMGFAQTAVALSKCSQASQPASQPLFRRIKCLRRVLDGC